MLKLVVGLCVISESENKVRQVLKWLFISTSLNELDNIMTANFQQFLQTRQKIWTTSKIPNVSDVSHIEKDYVKNREEWLRFNRNHLCLLLMFVSCDQNHFMKNIDKLITLNHGKCG